MSRDRKDTLVEFVETAFAALDQVDYYRVLGLSSIAGQEEIPASYYRLAQSLHPDVFGSDVDPAFGARLTAVFSRVVEAYKILSDPQKRQLYDESLAAGDLRMRVGTRARSRTLDQSIHNASARRFFQLGMAALNDKNGRSAEQNFKLALSMEPESEVIKTKLAEAQSLPKR